jgi:hypothetical protein
MRSPLCRMETAKVRSCNSRQFRAGRARRVPNKLEPRIRRVSCSQPIPRVDVQASSRVGYIFDASGRPTNVLIWLGSRVRNLCRARTSVDYGPATSRVRITCMRRDRGRARFSGNCSDRRKAIPSRSPGLGRSSFEANADNSPWYDERETAHDLYD